MKKITLAALAITPALILTSLPTQDAHACGNSERYDREMVVELRPASVMGADEQLQKHRWSAAISEVQRVYPELKKLGTSYQTTEDLELKRAAKIMAVSIIRLKSQSRHNTNNKDHWAWASDALTHLHKSAPDDPELLAFYAEALAISSTTKPKALTILSDLHKRDLLPSAYSYALLAKLHADAKDKSAAKEAHDRCMAISSDDQALCSLKVTSPLGSTPKSKLRAKTRSKSAPEIKTTPSLRGPVGG